jgi:hypothetical protein
MTNKKKKLRHIIYYCLPLHSRKMNGYHLDSLTKSLKNVNRRESNAIELNDEFYSFFTLNTRLEVYS